MISCFTPLFVPADRPDRYAKAAMSGADAVIIDLEDAVAPAAKPAARTALRQPGALPGAVPVIVRVNSVGTPWHDEDIACVRSIPAAAVMLPKAESAEQVLKVREAVDGRAVVALIETAKGIAVARTIAGLGGALRLAFGSIDFCADVGCAHTREALLLARSELVLASALGKLDAPLDGVTATLDDEGALEADAHHAVDLGFGGKLCIHPRQIATVRSAFMPPDAEIRWARQALADGEGAVALDGMMVDEPVRARARRILARVKALGG